MEPLYIRRLESRTDSPVTKWGEQSRRVYWGIFLPPTCNFAGSRTDNLGSGRCYAESKEGTR